MGEIAIGRGIKSTLYSPQGVNGLNSYSVGVTIKRQSTEIERKKNSRERARPPGKHHGLSLQDAGVFNCARRD